MFGLYLQYVRQVNISQQMEINRVKKFIIYYQDLTGHNSCFPCPGGGETETEGANSSELCNVYFGNFNLNHTARNLNGVGNSKIINMYMSEDLLHVSGTVRGWKLELMGVGNVFLFFYNDQNMSAT